MITIGFVVQRYGKDMNGETETIARNVAERLVKEGFRIIVFTTCTRDYLTWRNEFAAGESILQGVLIRRFPVLQEQNAATAGHNEEKWFAAQGPFCPALIQALTVEQKDIDLFLFFNYLNYLTVTGIGVVNKPLVLFPIVHDEPPLYLAAMQKVFHRPRALFFLTQAEMELIRRLFLPSGLMSLVRSGLDIQADISEKPFRRKYLLVAPYLLYVGRVEKGKGLEAVFEYYRTLKNEAYVDLVLIGKKLMDIPDIQGLKYLGQVSEADKLAALKGAVFSLQPSPLESLSSITLESFSVETPVLVNRRCQVLLEHVEASGCGLAYENEVDFLKAFRQMFRHPALRKMMGAKGLEYVQRFYSWDAVLAEIKKGIDEIL